MSREIDEVRKKILITFFFPFSETHPKIFFNILHIAAGLCPIIEPEVLLDGEHDIDRTLEVAEEIWAQTFK